MKNLLTIIVITLFTLFGTQNISAQKLSQDQDKPEVIAKNQVAKLTKDLGLNGDQTRAIYRALVQKEVNYKKHINGKNPENKEVIALKEQYDTTLKISMKKSLTKEQYNEWLGRQEQ